MKMKRLIATALAAAMIFGLVSVGLAASVSLPDIEGHEFEEEIRALANLNVIAGYPDGEFKAENTLTRAEFTKLIVCMLGLENMADAMSGETIPFADVDGSHWASGHILIAEALGIIGGYPDGTFKPEAAVTYAEAVKMVLTAMGYVEEGFPVVRWPVTWLLKAGEVRLDDDVELLANLPIVRGDVAKVLHNALDEEHVKVVEKEFTPVAKSGEKSVTFLSKLGLKEVDGQVVDSPELWSNTSEKVELKNGAATTVGEFDINGFEGLFGHWVRVWSKGKTVFHVKDLSTEKSLTFKEYEKQILDKDLELPTFVNYDSAHDQDAVTKNHEDIVVIYKDKDPVAIKALKYEVGTVAEIYVYGDSRKDIYFEESDVPALRLAKADVDYYGVDGFEDIKKDDVVHFFHHEDDKDITKRAVVVVARDIYKGTVTEIVSGKTWKIDGKTFEYELPAGEDEGDYLGNEVTLYLDKEGKVFKVELESGPEVEETFVGIVQKIVRKWDTKEKKTINLATILTDEGEIEVEYTEQVDGLNVSFKVGAPVVYEEGKLTVLESVDIDKKDGEYSADHAFTVLDVDTSRSAKTVKFDIGDATVANELLTDEKFLVEYEEVLWVEGKAGETQIRPRPHQDDKVVLYVHEDAVVIGVVQ